MKKFLKWAAIVLLVLMVLPLAVLIVVNAFDEEIDPKAAAYGEPAKSSLPEAENGYLAMLAMSAADGADGGAYARAWLAEARAASREDRAQKKLDAKRAKRPAMCDPLRKPCLALIRDQAGELAVTLDAYSEDLERYEKLIASRGYEEILDYPVRADSRIPPYSPVFSAQRAYLVRAALLVNAGKTGEAVAYLEKDVAFQRVMLGGARTLIGRMIAASGYMRDLAFFTDMLQTRRADLKPLAPQLAKMLAPVAPAALRMDAALESEFGFVKYGIRNATGGIGLGDGSGWPERVAMRLFHKPNATINRYYASHMRTTALLRQPPAALAAAREAPASTFKVRNILDYVYNPMGKILLEVGTPSFKAYALRLHDLDGYNRLAGLAVEIVATDAGAQGAADVVAKSAARFHDPYTGKPMAWDAQTRRLSFKPSKGMVNRKPFNLDGERLFVQL